MCSNKWAMNLQKLQDFMNNKLLPEEAEKYCNQLVNKEMPKGLKNIYGIGAISPSTHESWQGNLTQHCMSVAYA